jgi:hypothetical protein
MSVEGQVGGDGVAASTFNGDNKTTRITTVRNKTFMCYLLSEVEKDSEVWFDEVVLICKTCNVLWEGIERGWLLNFFKHSEIKHVCKLS